MFQLSRKSLFVSLVAVCAFSVTSKADNLVSTMANPGFYSSSAFTMTPLSGTVNITCADSTQTLESTYQCFSTQLTPVEQDFFVGPVGGDADSVEIKVVRGDGSKRSKSGLYNSVTGRSQNAFNLWVDSFVQPPLLSDGLNQATYILSKNGQVRAQGNFDVRVTRVGNKTCRPATIRSQNKLDCQNSFRACERYFANRAELCY